MSETWIPILKRNHEKKIEREDGMRVRLSKDDADLLYRVSRKNSRWVVLCLGYPLDMSLLFLISLT